MNHHTLFTALGLQDNLVLAAELGDFLPSGPDWTLLGPFAGLVQLILGTLLAWIAIRSVKGIIDGLKMRQDADENPQLAQRGNEKLRNNALVLVGVLVFSTVTNVFLALLDTVSGYF